MNYFLEYIGIINVVGFVLFTYDKFLAKARQRRIPESTLMTVATLGGAVGCYASMMLFRHKTRHFKFHFGIPLLMLLHLALLVAWKVYF